ncbi:hypothetical protein GTV15_16565 [Streptomyces sp. SID7803]|nr:hypothetical protein [Streptomyces sp. SID7803]
MCRSRSCPARRRPSTAGAGSRGVINRSEFDHWGRLPDYTDTTAYNDWLDGVRAFGRRFWDALGERRSPRIVLEHPGQDTLPTSLYLCDNGGWWSPAREPAATTAMWTCAICGCSRNGCRVRTAPTCRSSVRSPNWSRPVGSTPA